MGLIVKKLVALILSVAIGFVITSGIVWFFAIDVAPVEHWKQFPDGWRVMDLLMNALAVLMLFGATRAAYGVLTELWIKE